jgi:multiple sugar transport system permease protein
MGISSTYVLLLLFTLIFAFPFYYVFVLSSWSNIYSNPPHLWFGSEFMVNVRALLTQVPFHVNFFNSLMIAIISTAGTIFFCTMAGYAFAKFEFKGKKQILLFIMATMAIPPFLNIIPFFKMMVTFGWYQTWLPLIVPSMANAFGIFLMTQFLDSSIPHDLLCAARIDGLNEFQILLRIVFPLAKPGIAVLGTVTFIGSWNNFISALVMLPNPKNSTIPVALSSLFVRSDGNYGGLMAGTAIALFPLLIAFSFFSKKIISNLTEGSVKG